MSKAEIYRNNTEFTFKPKLNSQSYKIIEKIELDFMARQKQHLQKQKKMVCYWILSINVFNK